MRQAVYARANVLFASALFIYSFELMYARSRVTNNIEVHDKYGRCKPHDKMYGLAEVFMCYVFQDLLR